MIPGNRPEDDAWESFYEWIDNKADEYKLNPWEFQELIAQKLEQSNGKVSGGRRTCARTDC